MLSKDLCSRALEHCWGLPRAFRLKTVLLFFRAKINPDLGTSFLPFLAPYWASFQLHKIIIIRMASEHFWLLTARRPLSALFEIWPNFEPPELNSQSRTAKVELLGLNHPTQRGAFWPFSIKSALTVFNKINRCLQASIEVGLLRLLDQASS